MALVRTQSPDLMFLDIQMPDLDGFAVLAALEPDQVPVTVFVTAYDRYAIQAFEARALDYLLKPFSDQRFEAALRRASRSPVAGRHRSHQPLGALLADRAACRTERAISAAGLNSSGRFT